MFNPLNGKCDHVNPQKCRPGEQVYLPSNLKDVNVNSKSEKIQENVKNNRPKVMIKVLHLSTSLMSYKIYIPNGFNCYFVQGGMLCYKLGILQEG